MWIFNIQIQIQGIYLFNSTISLNLKQNVDKTLFLWVDKYQNLLAADSSSSSPKVVVVVCCCSCSDQVRKLLPKCYLTAT